MNSGKLLTGRAEDNPEPSLSVMRVVLYNAFEMGNRVKGMLAVNKHKDLLLKHFLLDEDDLTVIRATDGYRGRYKQGDKVEAFKLCKHGYNGVHIPSTRSTVPLHQLITLLRGINIPDGMVIDHIDGNKSNNERSNLRVTTQAINARNAKLSKHSTTGHNGVTFNKSTGKYMVRRYINGKRVYGGSHSTLEGALDLLAKLAAKSLVDGYTARHGKEGATTIPKGSTPEAIAGGSASHLSTH